jgi:hypothetical protein
MKELGGKAFDQLQSVSNLKFEYRVNSKYVTILKPQYLQDVNKSKMWLTF